MKASGIDYPFEIRPLSEDEGGGYAITFPDLPGCCSDGATPEEAMKNGRDALQSWLAVAKQHGDKLPGPFATVSGRFVQRVPRSLHAQLIARAKAEGVSLNTLIVSLVSQGLGLRAEDPTGMRRPAKRSTGRASKDARRSV